MTLRECESESCKRCQGRERHPDWGGPVEEEAPPRDPQRADERVLDLGIPANARTMKALRDRRRVIE